MTDTTMMRTRLPVWLYIVAAFGIAWNIFGLVQLVDFIVQTRSSLMMDGMTPAAADVYYNLPVWMKVVFAIGSGGGLVGSVALALRRRLTPSILAASLAGYVALWIGDYAYGVFVVMPEQMVILSVVVAIAAALLAVALVARRRGLLVIGQDGIVSRAAPVQ